MARRVRCRRIRLPGGAAGGKRHPEGLHVRFSRPLPVRLRQRPLAARAPAPRAGDQRAGAAGAGARRRGADGQDRGVPHPPRRRRQPGRAAAGSVRGGARGVAPGAGPAPLRRAAGRRHGAALGAHRRDAHRRGQDVGRHPAGLPQRARRQGRARGHRERLPGASRFRGDGPAVRLSRPVDRRDHPQPAGRGAPRSLCRRRHLRHQQRVRLRLPARQHEVPAGGHGPAALQLRHRRRGGLHPDRRGPHAADHLRPGRGTARTCTAVSTR